MVHVVLLFTAWKHIPLLTACKHDPFAGLTHKARAFSDIKRFSMGSKLTPTPKKWAQGKSSLGFSPGRDRMLSAKNHALRTLQNELGDTRRELGELKKENRLLNRLQARQERELDRFQSEEGELPQILIRHAEEVRVLKEQLRRSQDVSQVTCYFFPLNFIYKITGRS